MSDPVIHPAKFFYVSDTALEPDIEALPDDELIILAEEFVSKLGRATPALNLLLNSPRIGQAFRRSLENLRLSLAYIRHDIEEAKKRAEEATRSTPGVR